VARASGSGHATPCARYAAPAGSLHRGRDERHEIGERSRFARRRRTGVLRLARVGGRVGIRRRADLGELGEHRGVTARTRALEQQRIAQRVLACPVDELTGTDVCREALGTPLEHVQTDDRAAGNAKRRDPRRTELGADELRDAHAVSRQPLDREGTCRGVAVLAKCEAGTGLIPVHDCEITLPRRKERRERGITEARPTDDEERGVAAIRTADREPLRHTVDVGEKTRVDGKRLCLITHLRLLKARVRKTKRPAPTFGAGPWPVSRHDIQ
jgi:hypothetical protein